MRAIVRYKGFLITEICIPVHPIAEPKVLTVLFRPWPLPLVHLIFHTVLGKECIKRPVVVLVAFLERIAPMALQMRKLRTWLATAYWLSRQQPASPMPRPDDFAAPDPKAACGAFIGCLR